MRTCLKCGGYVGEIPFEPCEDPCHDDDGLPLGYVIGRQNREAVRAFFMFHVGCTQKECATALGLSVYAVGRHIQTLRNEWRLNRP